ncbi:DUF3732 domain-containing protein [Pontibacter liquoris]|uniref:DUF3732 domain-containing protein n=1 Tax=Pontibacter liquoris TaxID=2905677 RepID=UPI001FA70E06|nr:DUF3732 domain-containing protein [Pontibacter liquoris]
MNRWNIRKIILFSKTGDLKKELEFDLNAVNIITGRSHSGKSSIVDIIDYCAGSSKCSIPAMVRDNTSWVGILWQKENMQVLVCRRMPKNNAKQSGDIYYLSGSDVRIPESASEFTPNMNVDSSILKFEAQLGIEDIKNDEINTKKIDSKRVSFRHCMPFLLQDDHSIISKVNLFRGMDDARKRVGITDALPYFLGVINQEIVRKKSELKAKRQELKYVELALEKRNKVLKEDFALAKSLIDEARQVGLATDDGLGDIDKIVRTLSEIRSSGFNVTVEIPDSELIFEYLEKEKNLNNEIEALNHQIRELTKYKDLAYSYSEGQGELRRRLEVVKIIEQPQNGHVCPLCDSVIADDFEIVEDVKHSLSQISNELSNLESEVPKIDTYINEKNRKIQELREEKRNLKILIRGLTSEVGTDGTRLLSEQQKQATVIGRISFYLDFMVGEHNSRVDKIALILLSKEIDELESELGHDSLTEELFKVRKHISRIASDILSELPFDERYRGNDLDFNPNDLSVSVETAERNVPMREIGSDENYLSLHVAVLSALHRYFSEHNAPVPSVLVFDQLSRPYYNSDEDSEELEIGEENDNDRLRKYFEFIFKEVKVNLGLQVIILEHAFFKDFPSYVDATKYRWSRLDEGLIPAEWIN